MEDLRWYLAPRLPRGVGKVELVEGYLDMWMPAPDTVKDCGRWIKGKDDEEVLRLRTATHDFRTSSNDVKAAEIRDIGV